MTPPDGPERLEAGPVRSWPPAIRVAFVFGLALLAFGLVRVVALRWVCDDAFISIRYADNLVSGLGLVYNAGERVEGYTNFLWTVLLAAFMRTGVPAIASAHVLGILSYLLLVLSMGHWARSRGRARGENVFPLAAAVVLVSNDFHVWATGGLETMLFTSLAVLAIVLTRAARAVAPGRVLLVGCLLSLLVLTRLDGLLFAGVAAMSYWWPFDRHPRPVQVRSSLLVLLPVLVTVVVWLAWKSRYYGEVLPTAFYSKSVLDPYYSQGLVYLGLYLARNWFVVVAPLLIGATCAFRRGAGASSRGGGAGADSLVFVGAGLVYLLYVVHVGGDFMFARRLVPAAPFAFLAFENGLDRVSSPRRRRLLVAAVLVMAALPFPVYSESRVRIHGVADEPRFYPREVVEERRRQGEAIRAALEGLDVKVVFEGGLCGLAYYSRLPYLAEATGLTQYSLARLPLSGRGLIGHEKAPTKEWLADNGIQLLIRQDRPREIEKRAASPAFNDIIFGGLARASVLWYSDPVMDALRADPSVSFVPIERVLAGVSPRIEAGPPETSQRLLAALDEYYFRRAGDRGRREAERLQGLIGQREEGGSIGP